MERPISYVAALVNEILAFVRGSAQSMEIGDVERHLLSLVLALRRAALGEFVAEKGSGYAGREIIDAEGNRCSHVRDRSCPYSESLCHGIRVV